ncbi:hypothetical protein Aperf_G00000042855 [Anoplocephala perfoliata]
MSVSGLALTTSFIAGVILTPLTFEKPPDLSRISSFIQYRNIVIDLNSIQRLNSLHLLPCLGLGVIYLFLGMRKNSNIQTKEQTPDEKGDGEMCVLNIKKFILRSMVCHFVVSVGYSFLTIGIKSKYESLIALINQFDTVGNVLRKFGYLQQANLSRKRSVQLSPLLGSSRLVADISKLPTVMPSSSGRAHLHTQRPKTPTISSQRKALSTRERYCPTPTRPTASSPAVSVKKYATNQRSTLTKRSHLDALALPNRKKVKVDVFCETPGSQYITRFRKSSSYEDSLHTNNSASFYSVIASGNLSSTNFLKSSAENVIRKGVQFGPRLSPEQFDSRLPPSTPIKRGDLPSSNLNSHKSVSIVKGRPGYVPSPVLCGQSPSLEDARELSRTQKPLNPAGLTQKCTTVVESPGSSRKAITPRSPVKKLVKTPTSVSGPQKLAISRRSLHSPGLSTVRKFARTTGAISSPKLPDMPDFVRTPKTQPSKLTGICESPSARLSGIRKMAVTPKSSPSPRLSGVRKPVRAPKTQPSPRLSGIRKLLKTPKSVPSPRLSGIPKLLKTPQSHPSPRLSGIREMLRTPKSPPSPSLIGVRKLVRTPKSLPSPRLSGVRDLVKIPKTQLSPRLSGIREMLKTPKSLSSPRLSGVRMVFKTPKSLPSLRLTGVREMLRTPKSLPSPSLVGVRKLIRTPKTLPSPRLSGVRELMRTPKKQSSPILTGIREMLRTPKSIPSPRLSGIQELMKFSSVVVENSTLAGPSSKRKALKRGVKMAGSRINSKKSKTAKITEGSNFDVTPVRKTRGGENVSSSAVTSPFSLSKNANIGASLSTADGGIRMALRVRGKRKSLVSRVSHDARPPSPKVARRTRRQLVIDLESEASKGTKTKSSQTRAPPVRRRGAVKTNVLPVLKESEILAPVEKVSTRRTRRVVSVDPEKSSPVIKKGRSTQRVRFDCSITVSKQGDEVSRNAPVRRTRARAVKGSSSKLSSRQSTAKSLKAPVSETKKQKSKTPRLLRGGHPKI